MKTKKVKKEEPKKTKKEINPKDLENVTGGHIGGFAISGRGTG